MMTRIGKVTVCRTVGELRDALKDLPDHLRIYNGKNRVSVEISKITESEEPLSCEDEMDIAEDEGREPDFRRVFIEEGEDD
jgi:uncharacterized protein YpmS